MGLKAMIGFLDIATSHTGWGELMSPQNTQPATVRMEKCRQRLQQRVFALERGTLELKSDPSSENPTNQNTPQGDGMSGSMRMEENDQPGFLQRLLAIKDIEFP
jgi:hypothetical protein